jgi:predicted small secreted protein
MKRAALVCLLAALAFGVAGCGGSGGSDKDKESKAANPQAKAACNGSPLTAAPNLPPSFPMVEETTLTKQSKAGPTVLVEGYWKGDVKEAHDEYLKELKAAGYKILFEEVEAPNDSEISWQGEGRSGQVALRNDCGGGKIYVHITNRPA